MKLSSTAATTKFESKRQETTEAVEGMRGRNANRGLTLSFKRLVLLHQCFCMTVSNSEPAGLNRNYMLQWQLDLMSAGDQTAPSAGQEVL